MIKDTSLEAFYASRETARRIKPIIFDVMIKANVPLTSYQISRMSGLEYAQVHKRMSELERDGKIICTNEIALNPSGRRARKWAVVNGNG